MRRPLCLAALVWTLILWVILRVRPPAVPEVPDRSTLRVTGVIERIEETSDADRISLALRPRRVFILTTEEYIAPGVFPEGTILCECGREDLHIGQTVTAAGTCAAFTPATNPGQFDNAFYHHILGQTCRLRDARIEARSDTYSLFQDGLQRIRRRLLSIIEQCFSPPEAALLKAVLFGSRESLSEEKDLLFGAGLYWLLSVSSLQISLIGGAVFSLLRRRWKTGSSACVSMLVVLFYGLLCGDGMRLLRALLIFGLRMTARFLHRTYDSLTAAAVAAVLLLWQQPLYLYYSGFVLSFTAVLAAGILLPEAGEGNRIPVSRTFLIPLALLPVQLWFFYTVPVWQCGVRLLAVPAAGLVLASGGISIVLGLSAQAAGAVCAPLGTALLFAARFAGVPAGLLLRGLRLLARLLSQIPGYMIVVGRPSVTRIVFYFAVLAGAVLTKNRKLRLSCRLLFLPALLFLLVHPRVHGLEICYLDVGQGDGILIRTDRTVILIDGGSSDNTQTGTQVLEPCLQSMGIGCIDLAVVTHTDEDHINGLEELLDPEIPNGIRIERLVLPDIGDSSRGSLYHRLEREGKERGVQVTYLSRGERIGTDGLLLTCLHPEAGGVYMNENAGSTTLLLEYGETSFLFTGDLEGDGEEACLSWCLQDCTLCDRLGNLTCLKTAHHGSRGATGDEWLELVEARYAVISCGRQNRYGHPAPETVERLEADGARVLTTPEYGSIRFMTDGEQVTIYTMPP